MASCRRCATDLVHCHGTLVRHTRGDVECSDPGCEGRVAVHDFVMAVAAGRPTASEELGHREFVLTYKASEPTGPACLPAVR